MRIGLEKHGKQFVQWAIKCQTRSVYHHAEIITDDGTLYEATWPKVRKIEGVNVRELQHTDIFHVETTAEQDRKIIEFCERQLGKPYDLTMVLRFVTREQETRKSQGAWFCSELVFAAFRYAGINLLLRIEPWAVSPALIAVSPLVVYQPPEGMFSE